MAGLGAYIVRLSCCCILSSILLSLLPEGVLKNVARLTAGVLVTVTVISPAREITLPDLEAAADSYIREGNAASAAGEALSFRKRIEVIKALTEAYILDKASEMNCSIAVEVETDAEGVPDAVIIEGKVGTEEKKELADILERELGIAKENQTWIG